MLWSSDSLASGYERAIIGWDQRIAPQFMSVKRSDIPYFGDWFDFNRPILTIERTVWPSIIERDLIKLDNGFNLLDSFDIKNVQKIERVDAWVVQFDLPLQYAKTFKQFIIDKYVDDNKCFFLGYDVVDNYIGFSALYSFDWTKKEMELLLKNLKIRLNKYGLIGDEKSAIDVAIFFSNYILEHSPFVPCGIWKMEK